VFEVAVFPKLSINSTENIVDPVLVGVKVKIEVVAPATNVLFWYHWNEKGAVPPFIVVDIICDCPCSKNAFVGLTKTDSVIFEGEFTVIAIALVVAVALRLSVT
jgi:hypothetical protein